MIETPHIIEAVARPAAVIRLTVPRNEMMKVFGPAAGELMAALAAQNVKPAGPVFAHHLKMSPGIFDFELGVEVAGRVEPSGRMIAGEVPGGEVARTIYTGPYEGLPSAWGEFDAWMKAQGCEQADDLWEVYSIGPTSTPDATKWQTELNRPLRR